MSPFAFVLQTTLFLCFSGPSPTCVWNGLNQAEVACQVYSSEWSAREIASADLARTTPGWSDLERDVLLHLNLARMYPGKYWLVEIESWQMPSEWAAADDSAYRNSLRLTLLSMSPALPVSPDLQLKREAECLAQQQASTGKTGHERSARCERHRESPYWGENCSYGMRAGADVIADLLIDKDVPSLGHRINCLNPQFTKVGISQNTHPAYRVVTVMDLASK